MSATPRTIPFDPAPAILERLWSGRIRVLALGGRQAAALDAGDLLWVREAFEVIPFPDSEWLELCYRQNRQRRRVRWPAALARPAPGGTHPAGAMPVHLSRATLEVQAARTIRLQQIDIEEAIAAGVMILLEGYGVPAIARPLFSTPAQTEQAWASAHEAFGILWDRFFARSQQEYWTCNPEVRLVAVRCVARNIGDMVRGVGSGGAR